MPDQSDEQRREPVYIISVAARLVGLHPQTLRQYDRVGILSPQSRTSHRMYSEEDIAYLRRLAELTDQNINLAGAQRIIELEDIIQQLKRENLVLRDRVSQTKKTRATRKNALVLWREIQ